MKIKITFLLLIFFIYLNTFAIGVKSDTIELQNKYLSVKIKAKGAEIISIYNKKEHFEHIWQADKNAWGQHAPILFPIVGKLKGGTYQIDGETYQMENHGFASKSSFNVLTKTDTEVILEFKSSPETLKIYPYQFRLLVKYTLKDHSLHVSYTIENIDTKEIYFSIGAHPGFNIPFDSNGKYDDYYLEFNKVESVNRLPLTKQKGLLSDKIKKNYLNNTNRLYLSHSLFKDRAIILEGLKSSIVTIKSDHSKKSVTIGIKDFPFLGVWTTSKTDAPFICIEPWYGISDYENTSGDFKSKKGIQSLVPGKLFLMLFYIEISN